MFVPPLKRPVPVARPVVLTDDMAKELILREPIPMYDGPFPVFGKHIGWFRLKAGALAGIFVNQMTNTRELFGIDFKTGKVRSFGPPPPPKTR